MMPYAPVGGALSRTRQSAPPRADLPACAASPMTGGARRLAGGSSLQAKPHLVALRRTKISASDPPSYWWPGERWTRILPKWSWRGYLLVIKLTPATSDKIVRHSFD